MHITDLKLTLLFDNLSCDARFKRLWGFAALVETPAGRLLFDTGSNGRVLLENMAALGIDPMRIDLLFLSHAHWDHLGGLDSILELNPALALVVPSSLPPLLVADLRILCRNVTVVNEEPLAFAPGVASTGTLGGEMPEQALVMFTEEGTVVITGCAHPGIAVVAEAARRWPGPIRLLAGGFHLFEAPEPAIDEAARRLAGLDVRALLPVHCTGERAARRLAERFEGEVIEAGIGHVVEFEPTGTPVVRGRRGSAANL